MKIINYFILLLYMESAAECIDIKYEDTVPFIPPIHLVK